MKTLEKKVLDDFATHEWLREQIQESYNSDILDRYYDVKMLLKIIEERLKI